MVVGIDARRSLTVSFTRGDRGGVSHLYSVLRLKVSICLIRSRALKEDFRILEVFFEGRALGRIFQGHLRKTEDRGKDIIEIMGDAAREGPKASIF